MDFKKLKNKKGITLIALAVTIVVLLILAGVTISSVFSENGIINKALQAQNAIEKAQANDLAELTNLETEMEKYTNSNDVAGVDLSQYATLNLQAYVGRKMKRKCDYMNIFIEITNANNETEKITYMVGTDWKENINIENNEKNKLFLKSNSQIDMIKIDENDIERTIYYNSRDEEAGTYMSNALLINGCTDIKLSNLYVKKGNNYNVKIGMWKGTYIRQENIEKQMIYIYEKNTGEVQNDINWVAKMEDVPRNETKI